MQKIKHIFPYKWYLKDGYKEPLNGYKVFGTFVCGGGSTMGYKLAGFEHIGGVELTEHYSRLYKENHNPKYFYTEDIRSWNNRTDLPNDLFEIDLLDGSPPCASFSTVGARERKWGQEKIYEGHTQKTDDLVFEYVKTIDKLKPKTFLMENVSGLIKGNAKLYVKEIFRQIEKIGYTSQLFSLNAASMGVPQMRQRVFIIGHNKKYNLPKLKLEFNEPMISFEEATKEFWNLGGNLLRQTGAGKIWDETKIGHNHIRAFGLCKPSLNKPSNTITATACLMNGSRDIKHPIQKRELNKYEFCVLQSYPLDYEFLGENYSCIGRSVPPVMTAQIANQIKIQWLDKIKQFANRN